jgi:hypothetical protein
MGGFKVSELLRFRVATFQSCYVSKFQGCNISKFQGCEVKFQIFNVRALRLYPLGKVIGDDDGEHFVPRDHEGGAFGGGVGEIGISIEFDPEAAQVGVVEDAGEEGVTVVRGRRGRAIAEEHLNGLQVGPGLSDNHRSQGIHLEPHRSRAA